jgi:hypothetical protein
MSACRLRELAEIFCFEASFDCVTNWNVNQFLRRLNQLDVWSNCSGCDRGSRTTSHAISLGLHNKPVTLSQVSNSMLQFMFDVMSMGEIKHESSV